MYPDVCVPVRAKDLFDANSPYERKLKGQGWVPIERHEISRLEALGHSILWNPDGLKILNRQVVAA